MIYVAGIQHVISANESKEGDFVDVRIIFPNGEIYSFEQKADY